MALYYPWQYYFNFRKSPCKYYYYDDEDDEEEDEYLRRLFGPDGIRDHRVSVEPQHRHIGIGTMSREGTSEINYLWRAAAQTPHPRPRSSMVGEVGWGLPSLTDWRMPRTGRQIVLGDFRQECENRHTHLYQNPWYPGPREYIAPGSDASLIMNVYRPQTNYRQTRSGMVRYSREHQSDILRQSRDRQRARMVESARRQTRREAE